MNQETIISLKKQIRENRLEDETDLGLFVQLASRLAVLGDVSELERISEICERPEFRGRFDEILIERCEIGIFDVQARSGEELGYVLIDAQDYWFFFNLVKDRGWFSSEVNSWFKAYEEEANLVELDDEAAEVVERFNLTYEIPEEWLLTIFAAPMTESDEAFFDALATKVPEERVRAVWEQIQDLSVWQPAKIQHDFEQNFSLSADDGKPSESLLRRQDRLFAVLESSAGPLQVERILTLEWQLVIHVSNAKESGILVDSLRVSWLPARWDGDFYWIVDLKPFSSNVRQYILKAATVLKCAGQLFFEIAMNPS